MRQWLEDMSVKAIHPHPDRWGILALSIKAAMIITLI
jgi:hypothetical protein